VAPRGFDGTTLGGRVQVFIPITMYAGCGRAATASRTGAPTGLSIRPPEAGVSIEQARTALDTQYHSIVNESKSRFRQG